MEHHPAHGVVAIERGWVPTPAYLLRRDRVLAQFRGVPPGRVLEVGCGAGGLMADLAGMNFSCVGLEISPEARELARYLNNGDARVTLFDRPQTDWAGMFDHVLALEVLEHIADDVGALKEWRTWLKPAGRLILSVPAHPARWNTGDVWAGHYRRYSRTALVAALENAGFRIAQVECYGFPLGNIAERIRAWNYAWTIRREQRAGRPVSREARTARSGIDRSLQARFFPLYGGPLGVGLMRACCVAQQLFSNTELGHGFLAVARPTSGP
jgi:SAM-dependent methyltransferase